ncbi:MAG: FxLYD domain-containing protein [Solobacterium sp.]|nr:FxLYD domain-containing protein [Solobacterium sp.]
MKKAMTSLSAFALCLCLCACGSSGSSGTAKEESKASEAAAETTEVKNETKEEVREEAAWEVGESKAVVWANSIGTKWVQIICPVTNTGTKNLYLNSATIDLEDTDGHLVDSKSMVSAYPDILLPGETAYYYEETTLEEGAPSELSVLPHVQVKEATVNPVRYEISDVTISDETYGGIKIVGRVENTTEEDGKLVYVTALLYDSEDNMIASAFTILNNDLTAKDKVGFSISTLSVPDTVTASAVDHYTIYAYPMQIQF